MVEQTVHDVNKIPEGATPRVGTRGGLYYQKLPKPFSSSPRKPEHVLSGPGYEIAFFREATHYRVRYKGPNALKVLEELKNDGN